MRIAIHDEQYKDVQWNQVDDEHVACWEESVKLMFCIISLTG